MSIESDESELHPDEMAAISALSTTDIEAIDSAVLSACSQHWRKVAYVVSMAMDAYPDSYIEIPDIYYGDRIRHLVAAGLLETQGDLARMRFSEVRLTPPP